MPRAHRHFQPDPIQKALIKYRKLGDYRRRLGGMAIALARFEAVALR